MVQKPCMWSQKSRHTHPLETRYHPEEQAEPQVPTVVCEGRKRMGKISIHVLCHGRMQVSSSVFQDEAVLYPSLYWQFGCITTGQPSGRKFQQNPPTIFTQKVQQCLYQWANDARQHPSPYCYYHVHTEQTRHGSSPMRMPAFIL